MSELSINYKRFDNGLNVDADPDNMDDAELRRADNVILPNKGGFTKRFGVKKVNSTSQASEIGQVIEWMLSNGTAKKLAMVGNNLCVVNSDGSVTVKKALAKSTIGYSTQAVDTTRGITDLLVFVDGNDFYEYGGFDFTTLGATQTITTGKIVKNTPVSTAGTNPGTVGHYYQAKSDLGSIDLKTATYGDTTKWTDVTDSSGVIPDVIRSVTPKDANSNLAPIKKCTMLQWYPTGMRLFAAGNPSEGAALYMCEAGEVNNFKTDTVKLYPAGGSYGAITGMTNMLRSILVSYKTGWRYFSGTTFGSDVTWKSINIPVGSINNEIILTPQSMTFIANNGLYRVDQSILNDDLVVVVQQEFFKNLAEEKIKKYFDNMIYRDNARLVFHDYKIFMACCQTDYHTTDGWQVISRGDIVINDPISQATSNPGTVGRYYQSVSDRGRINTMFESFGDTSKWVDVTPDVATGKPIPGASTAYNNSVLVYDWQQKSFSRFRGWQVNDWVSLYEGKLEFASKNFILQTEYGDNDIDVTTGNVKPVLMDVWTKPYRFGDDSTMHLRKYIKCMYLFAKQYLAEVSGMTINVISDYQENDLTVNLAESLVWGRVWGSIWGFSEAISQRAYFKKDGTRHQIRFSDNSLNNPITIYGIGFDFETLPARGTIIQGGDLIAKYNT